MEIARKRFVSLNCPKDISNYKSIQEVYEKNTL